MATPPRAIEPRIDWFLSHNPSDRGMCAQHSWHSLGGDYGNPPAWGASDANACVDKVRASGRYWTPGTWDGPPPRGAWVGYSYGSNGHACLSLGDGRIATTDPSSGAMVGIEDLDYPNKWGASGWDVWTDQYNGVRFDVGAGIDPGPVYLSKLVYGQRDSDSVRRLQGALNGHPLNGGQQLPVTGNYLDDTDHEVRLCQAQHGFGSDPAGASSVGPQQAEHLFAGTGNTIVNDLPAPPDPTPPDPPEPPSETTLDTSWHKYSGKPAGTLVVADDAGYVQVDAHVAAAPVSGLEWHMLYANCDLTWDSGSQDGWIRVKYVRDGNDATGYQDYSVVRGLSDFLITAQHWEAGEQGVGGRWHINVGGGIAKVTVGTRYVKSGGVPDDIAITAASTASQALTGLPVPAARVAGLLVALAAFAGLVLGITGM